MKPIRLVIENLRSFRTKTELQFGGLNIFAIVGDTGVGKTSLLEAMTYALFNRPTFDGRSVRELVAQGQSAMSVEFTFAVGCDEFTVYRLSRRSGSQHRLMCPDRAIDVSGEADVNAEITKALQMDAETFLHTVLLPQGKHAALLTSQRGDRNRILEDIFRLQDLDKVKQRAEREESSTDIALRTHRKLREAYGADPASAIGSAQDMIGEIKASQSRVALALQSVRDIDGKIARCNKQVAVATENVDKLNSGARTFTDLELLETVEAELEPLLAEQRQTCEVAKAGRKSAQTEGRKLADKGKSLTALRAVEANLQQLMRDLRMLAEERERVTQYEGALTNEGQTLEGVRNAIETSSNELRILEVQILSQRQREREIQTRLALLSDALQTRRLAGTERESQRKAIAEKKEESAKLHTQQLDAGELCSKMRTAYEASERHLDDIRKANRIAEISEHLHSGENCPVCLRVLPKGFTRKKSADLKKAMKQQTAAQKAYEDSQATKNRLDALLDAVTRQVEEIQPLLRAAEANLNRAEQSVMKLLHGDVEKPEQLLAKIQAELDATRDALSGLNEEIAKRNAGLAVLAQNEAAALANLQNFDRERTACVKRLESYEKAYESRCAALPKSLQPKKDHFSIASMLDKAAKLITEAEANERRLQEANEQMAMATDAMRKLEQKLSREVREPRVQLIERLRGIAALARCTEPPADEGGRSVWAAGVAQGARAEIARLTELRAESETRVGELQRARAESVGQVGGEPDMIARSLEIRKNDAEHGLREAKQNGERACALDEKINKLDRIHLGLSGVREALQARNFRAYAAGQRQQRLLEEATSILRDMTKGRFEFAQDFQIFDLETNEARPSQTLSGGEKFLASLALSLGVVEIAANAGSKIESLFLDEGFDALDADTLQFAMLELRRRAHAGRMICVISHVSQVTEFVNETIIVTKGETGSEYTRRSGPIDDDDAAVERLVSHLTVS